MKRLSVSILFIVLILTACGGGGGSSSAGSGNNNNVPITSSSSSSVSPAVVAPKNINLVPDARKFTVSWNQLSNQSYSLYVFDSPSCTPAAYNECPDALKIDGVSSPYTPTNLENKKNYWIYLQADNGVNKAPSQAYFVRSDDRVFDNSVNAIQVDKNGTVYLGGTFTRYGIPVGHGYIADSTTGMPQKFPFINGLVRASVSDNKGGWFVGGEFTLVENQQRTYLVHILSDGSLDAWNPVLDKAVTALTFADGTLYVGGIFTNIDNQERHGLAAFTDNGVLTEWAPSTSEFINSIALFNNKIYVGGQFTTINNLPRENIAAINKNGTLDNWMPILNGVVYTLLSADDTLYIGGSFSEINHQPRSALAAFDKTGSITDWNPLLSSSNSQAVYVSTMVEHNSLFYIAGSFGAVNGLLRTNIAAVDAANKVTNWHPVLLEESMVSSMSVSGDKIYVGGAHLYFQDNNLFNLVTINTDGALSYISTPFSHRIYSLSTFGNTIFLGGELGLQDAKQRNHLAALDKDGNLTAWSPYINGYIYSLALNENLVYVSGTFNSVNGISKSGLAAITKDQTGNLLAYATPDVTGNPLALALSNQKLYVAGSFSSPGFGDAVSLAAVDLGTGKFLDWKPAISGTVVYSLAATNQEVYVGGQFQSVNDQPRFNIASFDAAGSLKNWSPVIDNYVTGITPYQQTVYLSGGFTHINGEAQYGMAALSLDGNLQPFENKSNIVPQITILNDKIYYGSYYVENDMIRVQILRMDLDGKNDGWMLELGTGSYVESLINDGTSLYIGGSFSDVNGKYTGPFLKVSP